MESARPLIPQRIRKMCCVRSVVCTVHSTTTHDDVEDSVNVTHPLTHLILYLNQNVYCPQIQVLSCQNGKRKKVYLCPPRSVFFFLCSYKCNGKSNGQDFFGWFCNFKLKIFKYLFYILFTFNWTFLSQIETHKNYIFLLFISPIS